MGFNRVLRFTVKGLIAHRGLQRKGSGCRAIVRN